MIKDNIHRNKQNDKKYSQGMGEIWRKNDEEHSRKTEKTLEKRLECYEKTFQRYQEPEERLDSLKSQLPRP
jgi:polyhydroxyalkanoate synthesis regulator phasin